MDLMQKRGFKIAIQYIFGILLDLTALSFLIYQLSFEVNLETSSSKTSSTQDIQLKDQKDANLQQVLNIFDNIEKGKIQEALSQCYLLGKENQIPPKLIEYFADFFEYYQVCDTGEGAKNCEVTTATFIKNAHYLQDYFKGTKYQDNWIGFAEIIPYYFIKNYNSLNKNQEKEYNLYKDYIATIIEQNQYLSNKSSDILCLYIYSRYLNTSIRYNANIKVLISEIEHFQETYPNQLGENGTLRQQRDYLIITKNYLTTQLNSPFRIKPKWNKDFPVYSF